MPRVKRGFRGEIVTETNASAVGHVRADERASDALGALLAELSARPAEYGDARPPDRSEGSPVTSCMPYRDLEALKTRHAALSKDLAEIQAKAKELAGLASEEERVRRDLAATEAMLREAAPSAAPLRLETLTVASPCSANWSEMTGDDRARFCGKCEKNVYNLSAMSAPEAEALLREKEGDVCVRFFQRADGTVMTADCPVGVRRRRVRRLAVLATAGGALSAISAMMLPQGANVGPCGTPTARSFTTNDGHHVETPPTGGVPMMGSAVAMPPPPPPPVAVMGRRSAR